MGVAVRAYYTTPQRDEYLESHLELWTTDEAGNRMLMPGYGWLFPLEDGRTNVGLGILDTSSAFGQTDYRDVMRRWVDGLGDRWQLEHDATAGFRSGGAALPMGFNRTLCMPTGCSSSGTPAAWSTRSTARASTTPSRPRGSGRTSSPRRSPAALTRRASASWRHARRS